MTSGVPLQHGPFRTGGHQDDVRYAGRYIAGVILDAYANVTTVAQKM